MKNFIKRLFCTHIYEESVTNTFKVPFNPKYEIRERSYLRSIVKMECVKCGKVKYRSYTSSL